MKIKIHYYEHNVVLHVDFKKKNYLLKIMSMANILNQ